MRIKKHILEIILISICFLTLLPIITITAATPEYTLLEPLPYMGDTPKAPGLGPYLVGMFKIGIGVAGVLAVIMIVIGGLQYMTTEAITGKSGAKSRINNAIFGLVLALSSYLLLNTINTNLTDSKLTLEPVPGPPATSPPVPNGRWYGYYKCGQNGATKLCYGNDGPSCQTSCSKCPVISNTIPCNFESELTWNGSCVIDDKKIEVGGDGGGKTGCEREYNLKCTPKNPIQVQACREAGANDEEDE